MIMKNLYFLLLFSCLYFPGQAQKIDRRLTAQIETLIRGFHGEVGVYVKNLRTHRVAAVHADTLFPTASMIKIPILVGIMDKINSGELQYHQNLLYRDSLLYPGIDILGSFKDSLPIELSKVMMLSLTMSDNTASLWLQGLAGGGARINFLLDSLGFQYTRVNSRTPGREANRSLYGWGQTTPREMATLLERIYKGTIINRAACDRMLRLLGRNYWDETAISQVPPYIFVASKNGAVDDARSETLLVMAPHGPYIFSVTTKNIQDQSWQYGNEAWGMIRQLSALFWRYFEPKSGWSPQELK